MQPVGGGIRKNLGVRMEGIVCRFLKVRKYVRPRRWPTGMSKRDRNPLIKTYYFVISVTRDYGAVQRDYGDRETTMTSTYRATQSVRIHGETLT
jgi:hypothetical protein